MTDEAKAALKAIRARMEERKAQLERGKGSDPMAGARADELGQAIRLISWEMGE